MKNVILIVACLVALCTPNLVAAQTGNDKPKTAEQVQKELAEKVAQTQAIKQKIDEARTGPRFVMTLTNVQIELTLSDQLGNAAAEKKTVSMIASSGSWGKIRSAGNVRPEGDQPYVVVLNVDARPLVTVEGQIQLELSFEYAPLKSGGEQKEGARQRPAGINQSQTVVLQSGKPLTVSQAADPISDRKVVVEVKATLLK
jgi:hypothetical protein